jgi:methylmalonyl-CoA/ethylmalonyl-CoA epimerase
VLDRIDHIGIAVTEIEAALELWRDGFGLDVSHREVVAEQGVEAVLLDVGENHVELLAPLGPDTPVGKFLAKRGPGLHHVAYQVADVAAALATLEQTGLTPIDKVPRAGIGGTRVAFLEPRDTGRVLVEIVQPAHGRGIAPAGAGGIAPASAGGITPASAGGPLAEVAGEAGR